MRDYYVTQFYCESNKKKRNLKLPYIYKFNI